MVYVHFIVSVVYGSCMPAVACNASACSGLIPQDLYQGLDMSIQDCNYLCCDGNRCNALPPPTGIAVSPSG